METTIIWAYTGYVGVILGLQSDNGNELGSCYIKRDTESTGYIGWGHIGIQEKKLEATT